MAIGDTSCKARFLEGTIFEVDHFAEMKSIGGRSTKVLTKSAKYTIEAAKERLEAAQRTVTQWQRVVDAIKKATPKKKTKKTKGK